MDLMKHKCVVLVKDTRMDDTNGCYNIVLRWLPTKPIYKMHWGVGGCEGSRSCRLQT